MPGISKGSTIKFLLAENKCYAFSISLSGTASALGTLQAMVTRPYYLGQKKLTETSINGNKKLILAHSKDK